MKHTVRFQPEGEQGEIEEGQSLLDAAWELGADIRADCGGKGACGKCRIVVGRGGPSLPPPGEVERRVLGAKLKTGYRLACCTPVCGPLEVSVPEESRTLQITLLAEGTGVPFKLEPMVHKYPLALAEPTLADPLGDAERLLEALELTYALKGVSIAYPVLLRLPSLLREARWQVTATVWDWGASEVIDVQPGYVEDSYGIAVDLGTTTIVAYVTDLNTGEVVAVDSMANPQVAYGADVVSRIYYTMTEKRGAQQMRQTIIRGLNRIIGNACARARLSPQQIAEMTIVGNTAMHHLLLGLETEFMAKVPFAPVLHQSLDLRAGELGLRINPAANVHILPIEAGFVGADNVAVIIATEPYSQEEVTLVIDIGTNGELVLGNRKLGLMACSVAAGPAFEGAHIQCGMTASRGAIEHLSIDAATYEVEYQVIGGARPQGICGSGLIDAVAQMLVAGIVLPSGQINPDIPSPRLRGGQTEVEFVLVWAGEAASGRDIVITQRDIRQVQLAKAAFQAGIQILMKHMGVDRIDKVLLAGAFGSYIDKALAMTLGLLPDCDLDRVSVVGNAAGYGARMALVSRSKRAEAIQIARQVKYLELTADPGLQPLFLSSTRFPEPTRDTKAGCAG